MIANVNILPIGQGSHVGDPVARVIAIISDSGLSYHVTATGTLVEGKPEQVFPLIQRCHLEMQAISDRVLTVVTIDDQKGVTGQLTAKVQSVEAHLGREVR